LNVQHPLAARRQAQPTGVIETLSAGFTAVNHHLWVLLLPIVLDLFLWLGPHVSYSPLVGPAVTHATEWTRQVTFGLRRAPAYPELSTAADQGRQLLLAQSDELNGLGLLAWGPIALPSVAAFAAASAPFGAQDEGLAFVNVWSDGLVLLGACLGLSLLLGGWFYRGLAGASSGVRSGPLAAGRTTPRAVVDVLGLVAVLSSTAVLLGLPVLLLLVFTALVSLPVAELGGVLVLAALVFASVHLAFAVDAIFVSNAGPLAAIQRSVGLVRRHLWPSVAFMVLTWLILAGMNRVWDALASNLQSPYGVPLGILGNAYIASGLIAAGMIFYTQRTEPLAVSVASASS
jgi:hypothetical protein